MPYIKKFQRDHLDDAIADLAADVRSAASKHDMPPSRDQLVGVVNYVVTRVVMQSFHVERGQMEYADVNAIVGVLSAVQFEFYRRMAAEYEDQKAHDNGDVPEYDYKIDLG